MKVFRFVSIVTLLCSQLLGAADTAAWVQAMHADDYAARQAAINALESRIAQASAPKADAAQRAALESELLGYAASQKLPDLTRSYVIRLLPPIASKASVKPMLDLVLDPKTSRMLGNDAAGLLAVLGDSAPADMLVKTMVKAPDSSRELLWSALALRADPRAARPLVKQLKSGKLPLNDTGIQALGAMGGRDAAAYLYAQWKKADGPRRTALARALVHTGAANTAELQALCTGSEATEIRAAALRQWAASDEAAALGFLQTQLEKGAGDIDALVAVQLTAGTAKSWDWVTKKATTLPETTVITVLQNIREQGRKELEPWVLQHLEAGTEPVQLAAMRCLAVVGGSSSSEALIARMQSKSKKVSAEATNAISVLRDGALDARLKAGMADPQSPNYVLTLDLVSLRNSPGSVETFNQLFSGQTPTGEVLAAGLRGMERIGTVDSVKLLLERLALEKTGSAVRAMQISIKRLVIRLDEPERVWSVAFLPALSPAATAEQQALIIPTLDAVGSPAALQYCIQKTRGNDAALAQAAEQALARWRTVEICDYWVSILNDATKPEEVRTQALRAIEMSLGSSAQGETANRAQEKAVELFIASEHRELRLSLIRLAGDFSTRLKKDFHKKVTAKASNLQDYSQQLEDLLKNG